MSEPCVRQDWVRGEPEVCFGSSLTACSCSERSPSDLLALLAVIESHIENFPNEDSAFYGIGDLSDFIEQLQEELEKEVAQKPSGGSVSPSKRVDLSSIDAVASLSRPQQAKSRYADEVATTLVGYLRFAAILTQAKAGLIMLLGRGLSRPTRCHLRNSGS